MERPDELPFRCLDRLRGDRYRRSDKQVVCRSARHRADRGAAARKDLGGGDVTQIDRFRSLVDGELLRSLERSTVDVAEARYLPPWAYTSEEWFEYEKEAVYPRSWLCVGRAGFLQNPGDYYTVTIN